MFSPWLVTVMTTLGRTAPDGSVTLPRIVPNTVCARAGIVKNTTTVARLNAMTKGLILMRGSPLLILSKIFRCKRARGTAGTGSSKFARRIFHNALGVKTKSGYLYVRIGRCKMTLFTLATSQAMCQSVQRSARVRIQTACLTPVLSRILGYLLALILLAECCWAIASPRSKATALTRPNILLITLDTTRADRMGFLGSERGLTPNLDALARQSAVFSRAYAQVPLTTPSHATILTGTYPQFSHVNYMGDPLDKALPYLPDILHKNGYRTAAFVGALVLDPKKLAPGFERGFDVYDAGFHRRRSGEDHYHSLERRGEEVVSRALAWLNKRPTGPFFLWVHLYDPHDPYSPPEPYKTRY